MNQTTTLDVRPHILIESAIFQESELVYSKGNKAVIRALLQTTDEKNQNGRVYPADVLRNGMARQEHKVKSRSFFGELDHPLVIGNDPLRNQIRQTTVLLSECSHILREYEFRGNELYGELETLNTPKGNIMANLAKEKVALGFSMRGMADLEDQGEYKLVKEPLLVITYDCVSNPSHQRALAQEITFETVQVIQESGNIVKCSNGVCYLADYFDKLVESKVLKLSNEWSWV